MAKQICDIPNKTLFSMVEPAQPEVIYLKLSDVTDKGSNAIDHCLIRRMAFQIEGAWHFVVAQDERCNPYARGQTLRVAFETED